MTVSLAGSRVDLDTPYSLTEAQIRFYRENGFVKLKQVFSAELPSSAVRCLAIETTAVPPKWEGWQPTAVPTPVAHCWRHAGGQHGPWDSFAWGPTP